MPNKLYEEESIRDIANAIREKNGTENTYDVSEMGSAIRAIVSTDGGIIPSGSIEITNNGTHDVTNYASAIVNVASSGGNSLPSNIITGTFTVDENMDTTMPVTVTHNIGTAPIVVLVVADEIYSVDINSTVAAQYFNAITRTYFVRDASIMYSANGGIGDITDTTFTFTAAANNNPLIPSITYRWYIWT